LVALVCVLLAMLINDEVIVDETIALLFELLVVDVFVVGVLDEFEPPPPPQATRNSMQLEMINC
jgi:hypothetical protein